MKVLLPNAVYINENIAGFRCTQCQRIVDSMPGDICGSCRNYNRLIKMQIGIKLNGKND